MDRAEQEEHSAVDPFAPRIRAAALRHVVSNITPLQIVLLPLTISVGLLVRQSTDPMRLAIWELVAVMASLLVVATASRFRAISSPSKQDTLLVATALGTIGVLAGLSPWMASAASTEGVMMLMLIPAVTYAVASIVCAGRPDLYAALAIPLMVITVVTLLSTDEPLARTVAWLFLAYGASQVLLYVRVSGALLAMLRNQIDSDTVADRLAHDQQLLSDAYEQLTVSTDKLAHLASHDPLTSLRNRRGTFDFLDEALAGRGKADHVGVLFCDIDRFKAINDLLGHRGGDGVLTVVADRMGRTLGEGSVAGRIGGDEFVVVLPGHDLDASKEVAVQLLHAMSQQVHAEGRAVPASLSIGLAVAPEHGTSSSDLLRNANTALHRAKKTGRARLVAFDSYMQVELQVMLDAEQSLREALDRNEVVPFFQPEIDASTGAVVGAELLARWLRPDGRLVPASDFIPLARRAGLLERLTERVLKQARPEMRRLASIGLPDDFRFRVNLGPLSIDPSWRNNPLAQLLGDLDPSWITVDVREEAVLDELGIAATSLQDFHDAGGRVCLDDFVQGVSSLSLLRRLPIDEVRVNRHAIDSITSHPHDRAIVRSIISVVLEIGLQVSAQGVETGAQADALLALGCSRQQGHLYAPALPVSMFERFLIERQFGSSTWPLEADVHWVDQRFD